VRYKIIALSLVLMMMLAGCTVSGAEAPPDNNQEAKVNSYDFIYPEVVFNGNDLLELMNIKSDRFFITKYDDKNTIDTIMLLKNISGTELNGASCKISVYSDNKLIISSDKVLFSDRLHDGKEIESVVFVDIYEDFDEISEIVIDILK
jgi:hypothetical protein